jgi:hypothetical protein
MRSNELLAVDEDGSDNAILDLTLQSIMGVSGDSVERSRFPVTD